MLKLCMIFMSLWSGGIFLFTTHPLSLGLILMLQTFLMALITGFAAQTFWMGYVLFLVFLGGMLVLFLYVVSLASNELFSWNMTSLFVSLLVASLGVLFTFTQEKTDQEFFHNEISTYCINMNFYPPLSSTSVLSLEMFYSTPTFGVTIFLVWYLLMALLVVAKIINVNVGPLRPGI